MQADVDEACTTVSLHSFGEHSPKCVERGGADVKPVYGLSYFQKKP